MELLTLKKVLVIDKASSGMWHSRRLVRNLFIISPNEQGRNVVSDYKVDYLSGQNSHCLSLPIDGSSNIILSKLPHTRKRSKGDSFEKI